MNKNLVIGLVVVLLVGVVAFSMYSRQSMQTTENVPVAQDSAMEDETSMLADDESPMVEVSNEVELEAEEYFFSVDQITVNSGETVKLTLTNSGTMPHDFQIEGQRIGTQVVSPGESETIEFNIDEPGTYTFYCSINNHREMGMEGTLVVE